ncbi:MAG TPA: glycosyltransferase [Thermoanaerobaculia bacterium]|nr:glycosyltransferase [Thermoanaerobaculia bacterium]
MEEEPRRILIFNPTFFPDPEVCSIRATQFARHLPAHRWIPSIVCIRRGDDPREDAEKLARFVHPAVAIEHVAVSSAPGSEPPPRSRLRSLRWSLAKRLLGELVWARFWWGMRYRCLDAARRLGPDVLLTSSPPVGIHVVGHWLSTRMSLPWVADFREAYLADPRFRPKGVPTILWPLARRYEASLYRQATLLIHQLPVHARWARRRYAFARHKIAVLVNGFPADVELDPASRPADSGGCCVTTVGSTGEKEAWVLALAVAALARTGIDVRLRMVGRPLCNLGEIRTLLGSRVEHPGQVPHQEALREIQRATVVVSALSPSRQQGLMICTKLIEYIAAGKPIVAINPTFSERLFLRPFSDAEILQDPTPAALAAALLRSLARARSSPPDRQDFRDRFSWRSRTADLAALLNQVVDSRATLRN